MLKFKKRVTLEFMGDEYKDSYIDLEAVPMDELEAIAKEEEDGSTVIFIREQVVKRFKGGSVFQDGKMVEVAAEDMASMPGEFYIEAFKQITGQVPKA